MNIVPYLNMTGNAEEALKFYQSLLGGEIAIMRWSEMPPDEKMPIEDSWKEKVMHGSLTLDGKELFYISDSWVDNETPINNNIVLHVNFGSPENLKKVYEGLAKEGAVNMPLGETFWGSLYGDLVDKFGISWGMDYQLPQDG